MSHTSHAQAPDGTTFAVEASRFSLTPTPSSTAALQHSTPHGVVSQIHRPDVAAFLPDNCVLLQNDDVDTATFIADEGSPLCAEDVEYLATLPHLTCLILAKNKRTGATGLALVAEKLTHLQRLDLSECSRVDVAALAEVAKLPQLRQLSLSGCSELHAPGFAEVAKLSQLRHLSLKACRIDAGLGEVAKLAHLQHLDLSHCRSIEVEWIAPLTQLTDLQHLDLTHATLRGAAVAEVAKFSHLQRLDLHHCWYFEGVRAFELPTRLEL